MTRPESLDDLLDQELSGVCFVRDYVELEFDGATLRAFTPIRVEDPRGAAITPVDAEWRDALCQIIGRQVRAIRIVDAESIVVSFDDERVVVIPLDEASRIGPEAAHFVPYSRSNLLVW